MGRDTMRTLGIVVSIAAIFGGAILAVDGYNTYSSQGTGLPFLFIGAIVAILGIWFTWMIIASMNLDRASGGKGPKSFAATQKIKKPDEPNRIDL